MKSKIIIKLRGGPHDGFSRTIRAHLEELPSVQCVVCEHDDSHHRYATSAVDHQARQIIVTYTYQGENSHQ